MSIIRRRKPKSKSARAIETAGRTAAKAKVVTKAPQAAASAWSGRRSGKVIKGAIVAVAGLVTFKWLRDRRKGGEPAPPPPQSYRAPETPAAGAEPAPPADTQSAPPPPQTPAGGAKAAGAEPVPPAGADPAPDPGPSTAPPGDSAPEDAS